MLLDHLFTILPTFFSFWIFLEAFGFFLLFKSESLARFFKKNDPYYQKSAKKGWKIIKITGFLGLVLVLTRLASVPYFAMPVFRFILGGFGTGRLSWRLWRLKKDYKKRLRSVEREKIRHKD